jgi:hypothetical protein
MSNKRLIDILFFQDEDNRGKYIGHARNPRQERMPGQGKSYAVKCGTDLYQGCTCGLRYLFI